MAFIELVLGLLLAVAVVGAIAKWVPVPLPLLLVAGGVAVSFVPGFASARIEPSIFFLLFIPPLLFADGWLIPKRDLVSVLRPVLLLAFGLVTLTVIAVGYLIHWLIPGIPLAAAFALGAIVSPTDAVAVTAITERLKMPSRITHILAGESLINDASGLVAFKFAVAAVATGMFSWVEAAEQVVLLSVGGLLIGLAIAWIIGEVRVRMARYCINDPTIQTTFSLLTPFAAYLAAEELHVSGILSVVAAGIYAGVHDTRHLDLPTRQHSFEVWSMLLFAFNGLVFLLLGVQLRSVLIRLEGETWMQLAGYAFALVAALIVIRLVWVFPAAYIPRHFSQAIRAREPPLNPRTVFLVGWAGIRGSVTMAAALSIPFALDNGAPFPGRDLVIFLAGATIVLTLVLNATHAAVVHSRVRHSRRRQCGARGARGAHCDRAGGHRRPPTRAAETQAPQGSCAGAAPHGAVRAQVALPFGQRGSPDGVGGRAGRRTAAGARRARSGARRIVLAARHRRHQRGNVADHPVRPGPRGIAGRPRRPPCALILPRGPVPIHDEALADSTGAPRRHL